MYQDDLKTLCSVRAETLRLATGLNQEQADFTITGFFSIWPEGLPFANPEIEMTVGGC